MNNGTIAEASAFGLRFLKELDELFNNMSAENKRGERVFLTTEVNGITYEVGVIVKKKQKDEDITLREYHPLPTTK